MFREVSTHALDDKGRLAIPTRFRDVLKAREDDRLVIAPADLCLIAHPYEDWQTLERKVSQLSQMDPRVQDIRRFYISWATECRCDRQGRVLIPQTLRERAGLNSQALLMGMQATFEIWDKDRWHEEQERIRSRFGNVTSFMAELGI